jgi:3-oxoacyl-[acyl-carrier-protein] synthase II
VGGEQIANNSRMVITGASAMCSIGVGREAIMDGLRRNAEGLSSRPAPVWTGQKTMTAAWIAGFKPSPTIAPMKARRMDRSSQMAIVAADAALREAGWDVAHEGSEALGIFLGSGFCGTHSSISILRTLYEHGADEVSAAAFPNTVPNAPAGQLAIHFGLEGPSATLLQTGTTADSALVCARGQLENGQCRAALWGGADELSEYLWFGWRRLGWVGEPSADRLYGRPLHPQSLGFAAGEASAMAVVEPEVAARHRGGRPLATIEYVATGAVESRPWAYPDADQIERTAEFFAPAIAAGGPPDLIIGCANGQPRLDRFEAETLARLVGDRVPVWLPKGQVGETMASTALRVVLAVWLIAERLVPANFWLSRVLPAHPLNLPVEPIAQTLRRVLIPTISAGGSLGVVLVAKNT